MATENNRLSLGRNAMYNSLGSLFYLVCQWLLTVLAVRMGSYEDGGMLSLAISVNNFFFVVCTFSIRVYQVSDTRGRFSPGRYFSTRLLTCGLGLLLCGVFLLLNGQYNAAQRRCILFYMLFKLSEAAVDTLAAEQQKAWRMDCTCRSFLMRGVASLAVFVGVMRLWPSLPLALLLMAAVTMAIVLLYDVPVTLRLTPAKLELSPRRCMPLLRAAWPMMVNSALMTLLATIPRYLLERFAGSEVLGIYGAIATPAVIIQAGCSFVYSPLVAPLSEKYNAGDVRGFRRATARALMLILLLALVVFAGGWLLGPWGLRLIFGESIAPYTGLLQPVLLSTLCLALLYFFEVPLTIVRRLKVMTVIHLCAVAVVTVLSLLLIPTMGMDGVNLSIILAAGGDAVAMAAAAVLLTCRPPEHVTPA